MIAIVLAGRASRAQRLARQVARDEGLDMAEVGTGAVTRRALVVGDDADLALAVAGYLDRGQEPPAFAFTGPGALTALFAHRTGAAAGLTRLHTGTDYACDLGRIHTGGVSRPFVGSVRAGVGSRRDVSFPWRGGAGEVVIVGRRTLAVQGARAVTVANAQTSGPWTIAPRAAAMDGLLDLQVMSGSRSELYRLRQSLRAGLHERSPRIRRITSPEADVAVPAPWLITADGMTIGRGAFRVEVDAQAFRMLV